MQEFYELIPPFFKRRRILVALVFLFTCSVFFSVLGGERDLKKDLSIQRGNSYIEGLKIVNKKDGADTWVVTARRADFSKDETVAQMESVAIDIKKEGAVVTADNGTYYMQSRDLTLGNNIKIQIKGSVLTTDELSWNSSRGLVVSKDVVRMEGNKFKIEGEGLTATKDNKVKLTRNVKATFF
ncbi:MAG TPA: LPS export ABC transporter periplasmic protein LptC [Thermodesulfovibrionales bacterium]|nr:LPS export ABC transporter periplasmic protein LptC [Thermodesulfovibrionales bacterium]